MGSESTSNFEVRSTRSRKRTKKKDNSEDSTNNTECNTGVSQDDDKEIERFSERIAAHKKGKGMKRTRGNSLKLNGTGNKTVRGKEGKINIDNAKRNKDDEKVNDEEPSSKKMTKSKIDKEDNEQEHAEDINQNDKNNSKEPSKRQIKKEKAEKRIMEKREASRLELVKKALNYVSKWKYARSEWKFEKLRQMWLIENLLDEDSIPDDIFPIVLEYFEGCKGMAREQLLKKGMDVIRKVEENEENRDEIMESIVYKRARKLLQALPTET